MTSLRRRMIEDMELKNLATRTINTYVSRVIKFAEHFGRSPQRLGRDDVPRLPPPPQERKVSWSGVKPGRVESNRDADSCAFVE